MADNYIIIPIQRMEKEYMRLCNILIRGIYLNIDIY